MGGGCVKRNDARGAEVAAILASGFVLRNWFGWRALALFGMVWRAPVRLGWVRFANFGLRMCAFAAQCGFLLRGGKLNRQDATDAKSESA